MSEENVTEDKSENPFQSPVVPETHSRRPFPAALFSGVAVTLVAFCGALLWVQPGVGILASLLVVPGLLRGFIQIYREAGGTKQRMGPLPQILFSILLMIPVLLASAISFGVTCFAALMVVSGLDQVISFGNSPGMLIVALSFPLLAATLTFGLVFWVLLFTGKKHPAKGDGEMGEEES
ncbi:MAG: hypothetical protein WDZ51_12740 [Pirellulaceae bacterium]